MPDTMAKRSTSDPVRRSESSVGTLDTVRPTPAKAALDRTTQSDDWQDPVIGTVVAKAVVDHFGSVKEAAYQLGQVDPSQMMREFHAGKIGRLDDGPRPAKAAVAGALAKAFPPPDPDARARQLIRETRARLDALEDALQERRR